jgi:hypothetical protein
LFGTCVLSCAIGRPGCSGGSAYWHIDIAFYQSIAAGMYVSLFKISTLYLAASLRISSTTQQRCSSRLRL